jgi:pilus assembly protein CpaE
MTNTLDHPEDTGAGKLHIAIIGPDPDLRSLIVNALEQWQQTTQNEGQRTPRGLEMLIREFAAYPADLEDLPRILDQHYDVVFLDLDSAPELAFDLVECIAANNSTSLMVYSRQPDLQLAVRSMRAGAREFLTLPCAPADLADALARASIRASGSPVTRKASKRLFVFLGTKGGCGVTTLAANFAVSLAQEASQRTLLMDLGLPIGDAAINLGIDASYCTEDAFQAGDRLDASFLLSLLAMHSSGLYLLAASPEHPQLSVDMQALNRLLALARQNFDYVVIDAGSRLDLLETDLFDESAIVYLVTQTGVSELRNANRLISQFFARRGRKLQIVLNRYLPQTLGLDENQIAKALTRLPDWRIPDDYANARRTQITATALAMGDTPISRAIRQMARTACGLPANKPRKKQFNVFRYGAKLLHGEWPNSTDDPQ